MHRRTFTAAALLAPSLALADPMCSSALESWGCFNVKLFAGLFLTLWAAPLALLAGVAVALIVRWARGGRSNPWRFVGLLGACLLSPVMFSLFAGVPDAVRIGLSVAPAVATALLLARWMPKQG